VEVLKDASSLGKTQALGLVYKNMNICAPTTTQTPTEVPTESIEPISIQAVTYLLIAGAIILLVIIAAEVNKLRKRKENK